MEDFLTANPKVMWALLAFAFNGGIALIVWLLRALGTAERKALLDAISGLKDATENLAGSTHELRDMLEAQNTRLARLEGEHAARRGGGCAV